MTTEEEDSPDTPPPVKKSIQPPLQAIPESSAPSEVKSKEGTPEAEAAKGEEDSVPRLPDETRGTAEPVSSSRQQPLNPTPVFIPPLDYLTSIPDELMPPLFPTRYPKKAEEEEEAASRMDYGAIYNRLLESTQRTLDLASRLAEVNRTLARQESEREGNDEEEQDGDDLLDAATATTSEDFDPETEASDDGGDDDGNSVVSASDIVSDIAPITSDMLADIEEEEEEEDNNYYEGDEQLAADTR